MISSSQNKRRAGRRLTDRRPISSQVSLRPATLETTTSPLLSKPMISMPTELVLPLSISCLWRNKLTRALPRPSSRPPFTSTPSMVLLPASTAQRQQPFVTLCIHNSPFPTTAILVSITSSTLSGRLRKISFPLHPVSFASRGPTSTSPPTLRVISIL